MGSEPGGLEDVGGSASTAALTGAVDTLSHRPPETVSVDAVRVYS